MAFSFAADRVLHDSDSGSAGPSYRVDRSPSALGPLLLRARALSSPWATTPLSWWATSPVPSLWATAPNLPLWATAPNLPVGNGPEPTCGQRPRTYLCGQRPRTYVCGQRPRTYVCGQLPRTNVCGQRPRTSSRAVPPSLLRGLYPPSPQADFLAPPAEHLPALRGPSPSQLGAVASPTCASPVCVAGRR